MHVRIETASSGRMSIIRIFSILLMCGGFIGLGICVLKNTTSGQMVAASDMYKHDAGSLKEYLIDWRKNAVLVGDETQTKWLASSPMTLSPDDGPLQLEFEIVQRGSIQTNNSFLHTREFYLTDAKTKKEIFHSTSGASERSSTELLTQSTKKYAAGSVVVPERGEYIFLAAFNQRDIASSNILIKFQAMAHVWKPDDKVVFFLLGCVFLGVVTSLLNRDPPKVLYEK